jgi:hypothetical protein
MSLASTTLTGVEASKPVRAMRDPVTTMSAVAAVSPSAFGVAAASA